MRILRSIVAPSTALMAFCDSKVIRCSPIRSQVICDEPAWDKAVFLQKLAHQFERRPLVPPGLDENVEYLMAAVPAHLPMTRLVLESKHTILLEGLRQGTALLFRGTLTTCLMSCLMLISRIVPTLIRRRNRLPGLHSRTSGRISVTGR